jgi:hypothetical protein
MPRDSAPSPYPTSIGRVCQHGGYAKLTDLLRTLADCPKARVAGVRDGCKARRLAAC